MAYNPVKIYYPTPGEQKTTISLVTLKGTIIVDHDKRERATLIFKPARHVNCAILALNGIRCVYPTFDFKVRERTATERLGCPIDLNFYMPAGRGPGILPLIRMFEEAVENKVRDAVEAEIHRSQKAWSDGGYSRSKVDYYTSSPSHDGDHDGADDAGLYMKAVAEHGVEGVEEKAREIVAEAGSAGAAEEG